MTGFFVVRWTALVLAYPHLVRRGTIVAPVRLRSIVDAATLAAQAIDTVKAQIGVAQPLMGEILLEVEEWPDLKTYLNSFGSEDTVELVNPRPNAPGPNSGPSSGGTEVPRENG